MSHAKLLGMSHEWRQRVVTAQLVGSCRYEISESCGLVGYYSQPGALAFGPFYPLSHDFLGVWWFRGPKSHLSIRILLLGYKGPNKGDFEKKTCF